MELSDYWDFANKVGEMNLGGFSYAVEIKTAHGDTPLLLKDEDIKEFKKGGVTVTDEGETWMICPEHIDTMEFLNVAKMVEIIKEQRKRFEKAKQAAERMTQEII